MNFIKNFIPNVILLEILLFSVISIVIEYFFNKNDPLFFYTYFSPTLLISIAFSLYYGFIGGLTFFGILVLSSLFFYKSFPLQEIFWNLLIVLVASEFRYYWQRRIQSAESEKQYLLQQIDNMRKNLYLLNLSHDALESNYIIKPYSLREMINEIKTKLLQCNEKQELSEFFLNILMKNFQVYSASLYQKKEGRFYRLASLSDEEEIDSKDPMIKAAIETETAKYISPSIFNNITNYEKSLKYLAVVAVRSEEDLYLLTIKEMLFVNLNDAILNYIYILLQYIIEDLSISKKLSIYYNKNNISCDFDFIREFYKMYELKKKAYIDSSVVVFSCEAITPELKYNAKYFIRSLDKVCFCEEKNFIIFLLPFTARAGAMIFFQRITAKLDGLKFKTVLDLNEPTIEKLLEKGSLK